jgi:hypothetical protein
LILEPVTTISCTSLAGDAGVTTGGGAAVSLPGAWLCAAFAMGVDAPESAWAAAKGAQTRNDVAKRK